MIKQASRALVIVVAIAMTAGLGAVPAQAAAPTNDNFALAELVAGTSGSTTGSNVDATTEAGEPAHAGRGPFHSVWYSWTAPASNGFVEFNTCGSGYDTTLAAYTGSPVDALEEVASDDDSCGHQSRMVFPTTSGTVYKIAVDGFAAASTGDIVLHWLVRSVPPNDNFANAEQLSGASDSIKGTFVGTTTEPGEPGDPDGPYHSVWYRWTAPSSGNVDFFACGDSVYPEVAVYTGSSVTALTLIAPIDYGSCDVGFPTTSGTDYKIAVDNLDAGVDFQLTWTGGPYRLDAKIKRPSDAGFTGEDVYGYSSPQRVVTSIKRGKGATYVLEFENEGEAPDSFFVSGYCDGQGFKVTYLDGANDITNDIVFGSFNTQVVAPGEAKDLKLRIKATATATGKLKCWIYSESNNSPSYWSDQVRGDAKVTS